MLYYIFRAFHRLCSSGVRELGHWMCDECAEQPRRAKFHLWGMAQKVEVCKTPQSDWAKSLTRGSGSIRDHENDEQLKENCCLHELLPSS